MKHYRPDHSRRSGGHQWHWGPVSLYFASPYMGKIINMQSEADEKWLSAARDQFNQSTERELAWAELEQE
jgi:hypothetical protein